MADLGFIHPLALIGSPPEHRDYRWLSLAQEMEFHQPEIATTAIVEAFVTVDAGLTKPTRIGPYAFLMKHAHIGHDAQIGAYCNLAPGCVIGGHVVVGDRVKIGIGASVRPRMKIGDDAVLGAGAVVVTDVPAGEVWVGNPARKIESHKWGEYPRP